MALSAAHVDKTLPALVANLVDTPALADFQALIDRGRLHAELAIRICGAVLNRAPEELPQAIAALGAYKSPWFILREVLRIFASDDPFDFLPRLRVDPPGFDRAKEVKGRSVSGHQLTSPYVVFVEQAPDRVMLCGADVLHHFWEAFAPAAVKGELATREGRRRNLVKEIEDQLEQFRPEKVDWGNEPEPRQRRSLLGDRAEEVIAALRTEISKLLGLQAVLSNHDSGEGSRSLLVEADAGGQLLRWLERQEDLPEPILEAYRRIVAPQIDLSPEEEKFLLQGLYAYQRNHSFVSRPVLDGLSRDLTAFLADRDPEIELEGKALQELTRALSRTEITLTELGSILTTAPLDNYRLKRNREALAGYEAEFKAAVAKFRPLFVREERWLEDSIDRSVPMERLRKTLYGMHLSVDSSNRPSQAVLTQPEFFWIREACRMWDLARGNTSRFILSLPINDFSQMLTTVIVASRKVDFLEKQLRKDGIEVANVAEPGSTVENWRPRLLAGRKYLLAEPFLSENGLSATDFCDRLDFGFPYDADWSPLKKQYRGMAEVGLIRSSDKLDSLLTKAKSFKRAEELEQPLQEVCAEIRDNPLLLLSYDRAQMLRGPFYSERAVSQLSAIAELLPRIREISGSISISAEQAEALKKLSRAVFLSGKLEDGNVFRATRFGLTDLIANVGLVSDCVIFQPEAVVERLGALQDDYRQWSELDEGAKGSLAIFKGPLRPRGITYDFHTKGILQLLPSPQWSAPNLYISRTLIDCAVAIAEMPLEQRRPLPSQFAVREGRMIVNFGKVHYGQDALEVDRTYLPALLKKGFIRSAEAREVAVKIVEVQSGTLSEPEFFEWLRSRYRL